MSAAEGRKPEAVRPLRVRDIPAFLRAIGPIVHDLGRGADGIDWLEAIARHAERVIEATAIGAEVERSWLEAQDAETLAALAARVLEVNADFFVRRVLPHLEQAAAALAQSVARNAGTTETVEATRPMEGGRPDGGATG